MVSFEVDVDPPLQSSLPLVDDEGGGEISTSRLLVEEEWSA